jgi:GT2 family glycosyltransferase
MKTTVGIVNWNSGHLLEECIESVLRVPNVKVFVLDNHSMDGSTDFLVSPSDRVTYAACSDNNGFAGGVNRVISGADTPYVLILNPDVRVVAGSIQLLEDFMESCPSAAAVGGYAGEK